MRKITLLARGLSWPVVTYPIQGKSHVEFLELLRHELFFLQHIIEGVEIQMPFISSSGSRPRIRRSYIRFGVERRLRQPQRLGDERRVP
jgi:hypothetical protein